MSSTSSSPVDSTHDSSPPSPEAEYNNLNTNDAEEGDDDSHIDAEDITSGRAEDIERLVQLRLGALEADYAATIGIHIQTTNTTTTRRSSALSAALASRPELAAKIEALKRLRVALSTGDGDGSSSRSNANAVVVDTTIPFDFPPEYAELQAADALALVNARAREWKNEAVNGNHISSTGSNHNNNDDDDRFGEFLEAAATATATATESSSSFTSVVVTAVVETIAVDDFNPFATLPPSKSIPSTAARPVSPLPENRREAITQVMARLKLAPRMSPSATRAADAALASGRRAIAAHKEAARLRIEEASSGGGGKI